MSEYRFRVGDGPDYVAEVPDGTYAGMGVVLDYQGIMDDTMLLRPTDGRAPFRVSIKRAVAHGKPTFQEPSLQAILDAIPTS